MSLQTRAFTKGDTLVSIYAQLVDADGNPVDLTGNTITFRMVDSAGAVTVAAAAVIVTALTGHVRYDWATADVDTVGDFSAWFIRTSGGETEHFPGQGNFLRVRIVGDPS